MLNEITLQADNKEKVFNKKQNILANLQIQERKTPKPLIKWTYKEHPQSLDAVNDISRFKPPKYNSYQEEQHPNTLN